MTVQEETRRLRTITTPEGLEIHLEIAPAGSRMAALALDLLFNLLVLIFFWVLFYFMASGFGGGTADVLLAFMLLLNFLIMNGYFIFFELYWRGVTPGKKAVGLRVVSRNGGPLTTGAVLARNLMRDLELFLPIQVLFAPEAMSGSAPAWAVFLTSLWIFIFLFMPFFNRDRARCGDLVAGTLVVVQPEGILLHDPAMRMKQEGDAARGAYVFTPEQLDLYGIKELQVLEEILRHDIHDPGRRRLINKVCEKITRKIGWPEPVRRARQVEFLKAFYRAQRRHLEERLLLGERRERKKSLPE